MAEREHDLDESNVLLTVQETIDTLRVGRHTLADWAAECWGPPVVDLSPPGRQKRTLRYYRADVLRWVESRKLWEATV
jgi:hypothetical protein